jgi:acyl carrier protein
MKKIREMIEEINPYEDFDENTKLFEEDILDSLGLMFLIDQIEMEYQIRFNDEDISFENFATISEIEKLVTKYVKGR